MFDLTAIKGRAGKRKIGGLEEADTFSPFDCPLPYYSTVPKQRWQDERFLKLNRFERGDFCLLIDFIWQGCGTLRRSDVREIAKNIGALESEILGLLDKLLLVELLIERDERLVQPELRNQFRMTLRANKNHSRLSGMEKANSGEIEAHW